MTVQVTTQPIDPGQLASEFYAEHPSAAVVTFAGFVRDFNATGTVRALFLECYTEMAIKVLSDLGDSAAHRFDLKTWRIVHRYGELSLQDPIVFVVTAADHRAEAFSACEFIMDSLKTDAPFLKREDSEDGAQWVKVRDIDTSRRSRWNHKDALT